MYKKLNFMKRIDPKKRWNTIKLLSHPYLQSNNLKVYQSPRKNND